MFTFVFPRRFGNLDLKIFEENVCDDRALVWESVFGSKIPPLSPETGQLSSLNMDSAVSVIPSS